MTDKELKRLRRSELLELLVEQGRQLENLKQELEEAKAALADRKIAIEESGTMAEAAIRLNRLFEAADAAAKQYLENLELRIEGGKVEEPEQAQEPETGERGQGGSQPGTAGSGTEPGEL